MSGPANRCGVLGDPIAHSLSPVLHRAAYAELGLDWEYDAHQVPAGELARFVSECDSSWRGLSLTMPLKREAMDLADRVSDTAIAAGAANTLIFEPDALVAENTDVPGAVAAMRERSSAEVTSADILGGGATAGSTLLALAEMGCRTFTLHVRSPERAAETVEVSERFPTPLDVAVVGLDAPVRSDIVVSTIPGDAQTRDLVALCAAAPMLFDVVYEPWPTPLAVSAFADDRVVVTGLDLLLHQAALQFTLFTGMAAPLPAMRAAVETARPEFGT